jgi:hypothetical protein
MGFGLDVERCDLGHALVDLAEARLVLGEAVLVASCLAALGGETRDNADAILRDLSTGR